MMTLTIPLIDSQSEPHRSGDASVAQSLAKSRTEAAEKAEEAEIQTRVDDLARGVIDHEEAAQALEEHFKQTVQEAREYELSEQPVGWLPEPAILPVSHPRRMLEVAPEWIRWDKITRLKLDCPYTETLSKLLDDAESAVNDMFKRKPKPGPRPGY